MTPRTERFIQSKQSGGKIAVLTAYDYPLARLLDETGIDIILVGDSLGMVVLGYPDTTLVTMDDMVHHTRAVARGVSNALVVADLPFHAYDTSEQAVANARRLVEAGAHAVKLEGALAEQIGAVTAEGIPVMAHLGMLPQQVREEGGYKIKGRTDDEAEQLIEQARLVEKAGAFSVVLELVTPDTAQRITRAISIPTIGIGSGADCDGQVLVIHDLVGLFPWFKPKFVKRRAEVATDIRNAVTAYIEETKQG
ncbi:MAG: 3-methyl-2-oxobutanoate hydroxymethyltransferase [Verrucomicrobiota bacterium]